MTSNNNLDLANCHLDGKTENSIPVTGLTHLHLVEEVSEDCATAGRDETEGCQSQLYEDPELPKGGPGLTLEMLSRSWRLPVAFLKAQGFEDGKHDGIPAIRIPYLDENGKTLAVKYQLGLQGRNGCFSQRRGDNPALYGLWKLDEIQDTGQVFLVDGVQDFLACWHHDLSALALPENRVWRPDWNKYIAGLTVFLSEKDAPALAAKLAAVATELVIFTLPEELKSLSQAHIRGMNLLELLRERVEENGSSAEEFFQNKSNKLITNLEKEAAPILMASDPIEVIRQGIRNLGYGGDLNPPLIVYLAVTSRMLAMRQGAMPVHLLLLGQPAAGKSYCLQVVLKLIPSEAYNKIDAGSPKVFIYDDFDYQHRVAIFSEADSLPAGEDNPAASAIRNMLQDHHLHYKVTEPDPETGQFGVREIDRPGPTVLITTSVKRLGAQLDSRLFSLEVPDGLDQIQAALSAQADIELAGVPEPDPALIAFQSYLQARAPWHVVVPFAKKLSTEIGRLPNASRITRDYARLISMIKTVAVLRHRERGQDEKDRIIAEIEDYALVHELVGKIYETSVTRVSDKIRAVLRAVEELRREKISPLSETKVAERLNCSKQAITAAVKTALKQKWLVNGELKKGYPFDLALGEPLPKAVGLPNPADLEEDQEEVHYEDAMPDIDEQLL